ncbi:hypothetical protein HK096_011217 [Nowakowskiella sp. JEL0078]|nr:hypothetical protein HK096_011217 [Nowakowskiella sp. JEL0078]
MPNSTPDSAVQLDVSPLTPPRDSRKQRHFLVHALASDSTHVIQLLLYPFLQQDTHDSSECHEMLKSFLIQVLSHAGISVDVLLLALKYIARIVGFLHPCPHHHHHLHQQQYHPSSSPQDLQQISTSDSESEQFAARISPRELIIAALALAAKWLLDSKPHHSLRLWARLGGLSVTKLIAAEKDCLRGLEFRLFCGAEELVDWRKFVVHLVATKSMGVATKQFYVEEGLMEKESSVVTTLLSPKSIISPSSSVQKARSTISQLFPKIGVSKRKKNEKSKAVFSKIKPLPLIGHASIPPIN